MKIIDKVLEENDRLDKDELISCYCPGEFGYKNCQDSLPGCPISCEECWNREVEE